MPVEVEFLTGSDSLKNTSHETSVSVNVLETKVLCFIVAALQVLDHVIVRRTNVQFTVKLVFYPVVYGFHNPCNRALHHKAKLYT